jgi:hypothetical protein
MGAARSTGQRRRMRRVLNKKKKKKKLDRGARMRCSGGGRAGLRGRKRGRRGCGGGSADGEGKGGPCFFFLS